MSETCPVLTLAQLQPRHARSAGGSSRSTCARGRHADPAGAVARRRRRDGGRPARRRVSRRGRRARALADAGLPRRTRRPPTSCGPAAGCTPATSAASTPTATCRSPIASRTSSRAAASGSRRSRSRTSSAGTRRSARLPSSASRISAGASGLWLSSCQSRTSPKKWLPPIIAHVQRFADEGTISRFAVPEHVLFVTGLERTSVGKLDKKLMREKYQNAGDGLAQARSVAG